MDALALIKTEIARAEKDGNYEGALYRVRAAFSPPTPSSPRPTAPAVACVSCAVPAAPAPDGCPACGDGSLCVRLECPGGETGQTHGAL